MSIEENSLRLNVGFIIHQSIGYSRDFPFEYSEILLKPDLDLSAMQGHVVISRTSEGLLLQVEANARVDANCVRCLDDFSLVLRTEFTELFYFASHVKDDTELILPDNGIINLAPILREYLLLDLPINPACREDCQGLCPICGENQNAQTCEHDEAEIDPRLADLMTFLQDDEPQDA